MNLVLQMNTASHGKAMRWKVEPGQMNLALQMNTARLHSLFQELTFFQELTALAGAGTESPGTPPTAAKRAWASLVNMADAATGTRRTRAK